MADLSKYFPTPVNDIPMSSLLEICEVTKQEVKSRLERYANIAGYAVVPIAELAGSGPASRKKRTLEPKYRNPDRMGETWSGQGMMPRWMRDKVAAGASKDDFLIKVIQLQPPSPTPSPTPGMPSFDTKGKSKRGK